MSDPGVSKASLSSFHYGRVFVTRPLFVVLLLAGPSAAAAAEDWTERKCALYGRAWQHASVGIDLTPGFLAAHGAFLASGCREGRVCPVTPDEVALADTLTLMAVAEGMAGSFLPFACPQ